MMPMRTEPKNTKRNEIMPWKMLRTVISRPWNWLKVLNNFFFV
jgi:hypothetical protein